MPLILYIAVAVAFMALSYLLMPKPPKQEEKGPSEFEPPKADAGKPIAVVFGTKTVKSLGILWHGEKTTSDRVPTPVPPPPPTPDPPADPEEENQEA